MSEDRYICGEPCPEYGSIFEKMNAYETFEYLARGWYLDRHVLIE